MLLLYGFLDGETGRDLISSRTTEGLRYPKALGLGNLDAPPNRHTQTRKARAEIR